MRSSSETTWRSTGRGSRLGEFQFQLQILKRPGRDRVLGGQPSLVKAANGQDPAADRGRSEFLGGPQMAQVGQDQLIVERLDRMRLQERAETGQVLLVSQQTVAAERAFLRAHAQVTGRPGVKVGNRHKYLRGVGGFLGGG